MKLRSWCWLVGIAVAGLACGDSTGTGGSGGSGAGTPAGGEGQGGVPTTGGAPTGGSGEGGSAGLIPDPGTQMNGEWVDIEPNDSPSQAVPMGTLTGPIWAGFTEPLTAINPEDDVDYFVFETGADLANVNMSLCWSFAGNLLDMNLYEVVNQTQGPLVKAATSTASGCETLIDFGEGPTDLQPNTTYLLEVVAAPGLALGGDAGFYSA